MVFYGFSTCFSLISIDFHQLVGAFRWFRHGPRPRLSRQQMADMQPRLVEANRIGTALGIQCPRWRRFRWVSGLFFEREMPRDSSEIGRF